MFKSKLLFFCACVLSLSTLCFAQGESVTITTYYPSPYGSYREMRSQRMAIGDTYTNNSTVCWENCPVGVTPVPAATDLIVEGNVGIGTTSPSEMLHLKNRPGTDDVKIKLASDAGYNTVIQFVEAGK